MAGVALVYCTFLQEIFRILVYLWQFVEIAVQSQFDQDIFTALNDFLLREHLLEKPLNGQLSLLYSFGFVISDPRSLDE